MKKFYYIITENKKTVNGGAKIIANIYTIRNNQLLFCCNAKYDLAACKGDQSEIFNALIKYGYISKKWLQSDNGYFFGEVTKHFEIKNLDDLYTAKTLKR